MTPASVYARSAPSASELSRRLAAYALEGLGEGKFVSISGHLRRLGDPSAVGKATGRFGHAQPRNIGQGWFADDIAKPLGKDSP